MFTIWHLKIFLDTGQSWKSSQSWLPDRMTGTSKVSSSPSLYIGNSVISKTAFPKIVPQDIDFKNVKKNCSGVKSIWESSNNAKFQSSLYCRNYHGLNYTSGY